MPCWALAGGAFRLACEMTGRGTHHYGGQAEGALNIAETTPPHNKGSTFWRDGWEYLIELPRNFYESERVSPHLQILLLRLQWQNSSNFDQVINLDYECHQHMVFAARN